MVEIKREEPRKPMYLHFPDLVTPETGEHSADVELKSGREATITGQVSGVQFIITVIKGTLIVTSKTPEEVARGN